MSKQRYLSQDGFVDIKPVRGVHEVRVLYRDMKDFGGLVCGGYVRWMCSPADKPVYPGDVDVYFPEEKDFNRAKVLLLSHGLKKKHENDVSFTFTKPGFLSRYRGLPSIQLIKPVEVGRIMSVNKGVEEILKNFDFTVVRAGMVGRRLCRVDADFEHDEKDLRLRLKNIHCPVGSTLRCMKYRGKGYWLPPTETLKLFFDWDSRTDDYKNKLIDFVTKAEAVDGLNKKEIEEMEKMFMID